MRFAEIVSDMDKGVALKAVERFPEFRAFVPEAIDRTRGHLTHRCRRTGGSDGVSRPQNGSCARRRVTVPRKPFGSAPSAECLLRALFDAVVVRRPARGQALADGPSSSRRQSVVKSGVAKVASGMSRSSGSGACELPSSARAFLTAHGTSRVARVVTGKGSNSHAKGLPTHYLGDRGLSPAHPSREAQRQGRVLPPHPGRRAHVRAAFGPQRASTSARSPPGTSTSTSIGLTLRSMSRRPASRLRACRQRYDTEHLGPVYMRSVAQLVVGRR